MEPDRGRSNLLSRRCRAAKPGTAVFFGLAIAIIAAGQTADLEYVSILGPKSPSLEAAANGAVTLALKKLADPRCQRVFTDFRDPSGHPLQRRLDSLGHSGGDFLRILRFANGVGLLPCQFRGVLAATTPLSHVIFLCGSQFFERQRIDPEYGAALVIHEELHSLGLGENPPASNAITMGVIARCGARALGNPIDATALLRPVAVTVPTPNGEPFRP
jgi:hypothetical protein